MADSLKKVKTKINKKIKNIIVGAVSAVVIFTVGFQVLFNAPIRKIDKSKVKISAEVYPIEMLPHSLTADGDSVEISLGENDESDVCKVEIPAIPDAQMSISENAEEKSEFATVITTSSDYFLRTVKWEIKDDTIYISAFKTTILNNKAQSYQKNMTSIEFKEIRKIVFVENGTETVLWKK